MFLSKQLRFGNALDAKRVELTTINANENMIGVKDDFAG
jgi:hypothetical protein